MGISFPAKHTEEVTANASVDLWTKVREAARSLAWDTEYEKPASIGFKSSMGIRSFGEVVTVEFLENRTLRITSKCALPTQCIDWGKNKANVRSFIEALHL